MVRSTAPAVGRARVPVSVAGRAGRDHASALVADMPPVTDRARVAGCPLCPAAPANLAMASRPWRPCPAAPVAKPRRPYPAPTALVTMAMGMAMAHRLCPVAPVALEPYPRSVAPAATPRTQ